MVRVMRLTILGFVLAMAFILQEQPPHGRYSGQDARLVLAAEQSPAQSEDDDAFLDMLARDTWSYLSSDWATDHSLPWSWRSYSLEGGDYANPAEIGFLALSWIGAFEMKRPWSPAWSDVEEELLAILTILRNWQTGEQTYQPHGPNAYKNAVFYQWYWINEQEPVVGGNEQDHVVPAIDNAWLAASLITIREYAQENGHRLVAQKATAVLADMDFTLWYDDVTHRFKWGGVENPQGGGALNYYSNENRIVNFVAYALGQISSDEFQQSLDALIQQPAAYDSIIVEKAAWDGSYFTYTAPALFIREMHTAYGEKTIIPATSAQIAYAQDRGYMAWGLSDCFDVGAGDYLQQGALPAASPVPPETKPGLVAPHASALALITPLAPESISNLRLISQTWPEVYDPVFGFRDSVMARPGDDQYGMPSDRFGTLGQEWLFLTIANMQTEFIWLHFYSDAGVIRAHQTMFGLSPVFVPFVLRN